METTTTGVKIREPRIAIIGAGMSGICAAAMLQRAGIHDIDVYEKSERVGGTWRDNTYPGLSCDVPSRYYCYSFFPNPHWTRLFSPGPDIDRYLNLVADKLNIRRKIKFRTEVEAAEWTGHQWEMRTSDGKVNHYDFVIAASGVLHHPRLPSIPGLENFAGASFHSARWDHEVPLDGRRVGVIGTGSTGVQITAALSPRCASYKLFQRTPQWILPCGNLSYSGMTRRVLAQSPTLNRLWGKVAYRFYQFMFEHTFGTAVIRPGWQRRLLSAACRMHLRKVQDPVLRERFRPSDKPMCKRTVIATGFYERFNSGLAELVDSGIDHISERGVVTQDGRLHELDVLVLATGFHTHSYVRPVELSGIDGVTLSEVWDPAPHAYRTVALSGFPNFFLMLGPHSPVGNQSLFMITETQVRYAIQWINRWRRGEYDSAMPSEEASQAFNEELTRDFPNTIWASGCSSWYIAPDGRPSIWPRTAEAHRDMLAAPQDNEWRLSLTSSSQADIGENSGPQPESDAIPTAIRP